MVFNLYPSWHNDPFAYDSPVGSLPNTDTTGLTTAVPALNPQARNFLAVVHGQSLGTNRNPTTYTVTNPTKVHQVNWAGNRLLYQHKEPMLGCTSVSTSVSFWGKVGDMLIDNNIFDRVIWCNINAGGQTVASFAPGGLLGMRIAVAFNVLRSLGYAGSDVSAILSMIGETDSQNDTAAAAYKASCRESMRVARSFGFAGPWFVPQETFISGATDAAIRQAQADLWLEAGFVAGPDFDTLGAPYRDADNVHLNASAYNPATQLWYDAIREQYT